MGKGCGGQTGGRHILYGSRVKEHIGDNNDTRYETHDDRVPENGGHGDICLIFRIVRAGGRSRDGGSADAGFVGKKPPRDTVA